MSECPSRASLSGPLQPLGQIPALDLRLSELPLIPGFIDVLGHEYTILCAVNIQFLLD